MKNILFVCYGNICRSPSAQGIFENLLGELNLSQNYFVDSAGTHDFHIGKLPDSRAISAAAKHNVDLTVQQCRQFCEADFDKFDHIFVMDKLNKKFLTETWPKQSLHKIKEFIEFAPDTNLDKVPDPFRGSSKDFDEMMELLFMLCKNSLKHIS